MKRAKACGPVNTGLRAALSLLVAVVALLCVSGHVQRDGSPTRPSAAEVTHLSASVEAPALSASVEAPAGAATPCGQKAVADQTAQRAENVPPVTDCSGCPAFRDGTAAARESRSGAYAGGPAPPPPSSLHSVLRI